MSIKRKTGKAAAVVAPVAEFEPAPIVRYYTIYRTASPYRWRLVYVAVQGDQIVSQDLIEENVPGIIKVKLMHAIIQDMDARDKIVRN